MPTIQDVARACGVSPATVSYVINNGPRSVRAQTRERVLQTISDLKYDPSAVARGLRRKRMDTIGVVLPHAHVSLASNPYFAALLDGILATAMDRRQNTTLYTGQMWTDGRQSLATYCDGRCDGLLLIAPPLDSDIVLALKEKGLPFVLVSDHREDEGVSCVDVDNTSGARLAVEHLIQQGHRQIAMLCGPESASSVRLRVAGYRNALERAGVNYDPSLVLMGHYREESGYENTLALLSKERATPPTAIFCASDAIALGSLQALYELGLRVPGDLSVVGFDDIPPASTCNPPLTTVKQPLRLLGECATEMLLDQIDRTRPPGAKDILPAALVFRDSVGPPAQSRGSVKADRSR